MYLLEKELNSVLITFLKGLQKFGQETAENKTEMAEKSRWDQANRRKKPALLDGTNVRLNWNIESDLNVYWIKFKNFLSLY